MNRDQILELLSSHKTILEEQFDVSRIALFGSAARDTMSADSDIDILVTFEGPATSDRYFGVQFYLEDLLACSIDLVTTKALRRELKPYVEKEAVYV